MKLTLPLVIALLLVPSLALAGTFSRNPDADTLLGLSGADIAQLQNDAQGWPFDVKLLVERVDSVSTLGRDAHNLVTNPNVMVLAIDPSGRVLTRFGKGTGVKTGDFDSISKAGNEHFHNHKWVQGVELVVARAQASAQATVSMSQSATPVTIEHTHGMSGGTVFLIILLFGGMTALVIWLVRRSRKQGEEFKSALDANRMETAELVSRNVDSMTESDQMQDFERRLRASQPARPAPVSRPTPAYRGPTPPPVYAPPAPAPVIINNQQPSRTDDGFVEGMLLGQALSQPRVVEREVIVERDSGYSRRRYRDDDDGGGGSSMFSNPSPSRVQEDDDNGGSSSTFDTSDSGSMDIGGGSSETGGGNDGGGSDSSF